MSNDEARTSGGETRLFVAVALPDKLRAKLHELGRTMKDEMRFQKWTHPDDIHITLKFLGETSGSRIGAIEDALRRISASGGSRSFELSAAGLGVFGPPSRPTILWAGLQGDLKPLHELQHRIEEALAPLGYEREDRPYRPHLTLARRYNGSSGFQRRSLETAMKLLPEEGFRWTVQSFTLYRSHLGRTPMYEAIAGFEFG